MSPLIDRIGLLFEPPTQEGGEPVALAGWHANTTQEVLTARPELEPFVVTPTRLRRVWAGDVATDPVITVALRLADEAEAADLLAF